MFSFLKPHKGNYGSKGGSHFNLGMAIALLVQTKQVSIEEGL
jgi:hypothetical protein